MTHFPRAVLITVLLTAGTLPVISFQQTSVQPPPRDVRGTARVSGVVAGVDGVPVEGTILTLMSSVWKKTIAVSDAAGRFAFTALPAELYHLRAEKQGFLETYFGAVRPGGDGTAIALGTGQRMDDLTITLIRTAAISGMVRLPDRTAAAGVTVYVTPKDGKGIAGVGHTDERGAYRVGDLHVGEYKVHAMPFSERAAIPVFHPGTTSPRQATTLRIDYGEERERVDISMVDEPPVALSGVVLNLAGLPVAGVQLFSIPVGWGGGAGNLSRTSGPNGEFAYEGVFPGQYNLRAYLPAAPDAPTSDPATLWATETVDVPLDGTSPLTLRLQSPLVFSGRVRFIGRTRPPPDLTSVRLDLDQDGWKPTTVDLGADGTFARSVLPGTYQIGGFVPDAASTWELRSAVKDGRDLLDTPLEFSVSTGSITDVELTFSDQHTHLSGVVTVATGTPLAACYVIAFPGDRALWPASGSVYYRRLTYRRPATNGRFVFESLPPGDYFLGVVPHLDPIGWRTPEFLESLVERATRVTLREGEQKIQDVRVGGR